MFFSESILSTSIQQHTPRSPSATAKQHIMPEAEEYTIGWICALTKELIAAKAFLDVLHDPVDNAAINDDNNYTLGSIGKHNVVIAVLPYG
ncbi:hypothetical protein ACKLNR_014312 [Fusarium oxysporum f. sp. zingiberi]